MAGIALLLLGFVNLPAVHEKTKRGELTQRWILKSLPRLHDPKHRLQTYSDPPAHIASPGRWWGWMEYRGRSAVAYTNGPGRGTKRKFCCSRFLGCVLCDSTCSCQEIGLTKSRKWRTQEVLAWRIVVPVPNALAAKNLFSKQTTYCSQVRFALLLCCAFWLMTNISRVTWNRLHF